MQARTSKKMIFIMSLDNFYYTGIIKIIMSLDNFYYTRIVKIIQ